LNLSKNYFSGSTTTIAFTNEPGQYFSIPLTLLTTLPHQEHLLETVQILKNGLDANFEVVEALTLLMPENQIVVTVKVLQKSLGTTHKHLAQLILCKVLSGCENVSNDAIEILTEEKEDIDLMEVDKNLEKLWTLLKKNTPSIAIPPGQKVTLELKLKSTSNLKNGCYIKVTPDNSYLTRSTKHPSQLVDGGAINNDKIVTVTISNISKQEVTIENDQVFGTASVVKMPVVFLMPKECLWGAQIQLTAIFPDEDTNQIFYVSPPVKNRLGRQKNNQNVTKWMHPQDLLQSIFDNRGNPDELLLVMSTPYQCLKILEGLFPTTSTSSTQTVPFGLKFFIVPDKLSTKTFKEKGQRQKHILNLLIQQGLDNIQKTPINDWIDKKISLDYSWREKELIKVEFTVITNGDSWLNNSTKAVFHEIVVNSSVLEPFSCTLLHSRTKHKQKLIDTEEMVLRACLDHLNDLRKACNKKSIILFTTSKQCIDLLYNQLLYYRLGTEFQSYVAGYKVIKQVNLTDEDEGKTTLEITQKLAVNMSQDTPENDDIYYIFHKGKTTIQLLKHFETDKAYWKYKSWCIEKSTKFIKEAKEHIDLMDVDTNLEVSEKLWTLLRKNTPSIAIPPGQNVTLELKLKSNSNLKSGCYIKVKPDHSELTCPTKYPSQLVVGQVNDDKIVTVIVRNISKQEVTVENDQVFGAASVVKMPVVFLMPRECLGKQIQLTVIFPDEDTNQMFDVAPPVKNRLGRKQKYQNVTKWMNPQDILQKIFDNRGNPDELLLVISTPFHCYQILEGLFPTTSTRSTQTVSIFGLKFFIVPEKLSTKTFIQIGQRQKHLLNFLIQQGLDNIEKTPINDWIDKKINVDYNWRQKELIQVEFTVVSNGNSWLNNSTKAVFHEIVVISSVLAPFTCTVLQSRTKHRQQKLQKVVDTEEMLLKAFLDHLYDLKKACNKKEIILFTSSKQCIDLLYNRLLYYSLSRFGNEFHKCVDGYKVFKEFNLTTEDEEKNNLEKITKKLAANMSQAISENEIYYLFHKTKSTIGLLKQFEADETYWKYKSWLMKKSTEVQGKELIKQPDITSSSDELTIAAEQTVIIAPSTDTSNTQESHTCHESFEAPETTVVPETLVVPETAVIPETEVVQETETAVVPETSVVPETEVVPETSVVPETAVVPETTVVQETAVVPETSELPETSVVQETTVVQEKIKSSDSRDSFSPHKSQSAEPDPQECHENTPMSGPTTSDNVKNINQTYGVENDTIIQPASSENSELQPETSKPKPSEKSDLLAHQEDPENLQVLGIDDPHSSNTGKTISQDVLQSQSQQEDLDIVPAVNPIINIFLSKRQVIHDSNLRYNQLSAPWIAELAVEEDLKPGTKVKCLEVTSSKHFHLKKDDIYEVYCGRYLMLSGMGSTSLTKDVGYLSIGNGQLCRDAPTQSYCNKTHEFVTFSRPPCRKKTRIQLTSTKKAQDCTFERHAIILQSPDDNIVMYSAYLVRHIFLKWWTIH
jgi:hypothetical protein